MNSLSKLVRPALILLFVAATVIFAGCAQQADGSNLGESALPWNRPASWEGGGALGSQMNSMSGH